MIEHLDKIHVHLNGAHSFSELDAVRAMHSRSLVKGGHGRVWRRSNYQEEVFPITCTVEADGLWVHSSEGDVPEDLADLDDGLGWDEFRSFIADRESSWNLDLTITILKPEGERGEFFCYTGRGLELASDEVRRLGKESRGPPERVVVRTPLVNEILLGESFAVTPLSDSAIPSASGRYLVPSAIPSEIESALATIQAEMLFGWVLGQNYTPTLSIADARQLASHVQAHRLMTVVGRRVLADVDWSSDGAVGVAMERMSTMEDMLVAQAANELKSDIEGLRNATAEFVRDLQKTKSEILSSLNTDLFKIVAATLVTALGLPYAAITDYRSSIWLALGVGGIFLLGAIMKSWSLTGDFNRLYALRAELARRTAARPLPDIHDLILATARKLRESYYRALSIGIGANAIPVAVTLALLGVEYGLLPAGRILWSALACVLITLAVVGAMCWRPWNDDSAAHSQAAPATHL